MFHTFYRPRAIRLCVPALMLLGPAACSPASETPPETDWAAIEDSVLALEESMNAGIDSLDCRTGLVALGEREPIFVFNGSVVRTASAFREGCEQVLAPRTGAVWDVETITANALSEDVVYVVREGSYTVHYKEREAGTSYLVMTTIWHRQGSGWRMVHLHESSRSP